MAEITGIASGLTRSESGIWVSSNERSISFPEDAHDDLMRIEDVSFWFRHRNRCITALVDAFRPEGVMLDIGGGNGYVSRALTEMGVDAVLVEPRLDGAMNAMRRGLGNIVCSTFEDAGFMDGSISAIGLFDVLEHVEDDAALLRSIRGSLKGGGRVFVTVPAHKALWSYEDEYAGHFSRYSISGLRLALGSAGYEIEYVSHFFSLLIAPIFLMRALPTRLGIRRGYDREKNLREHGCGSASASMMESALNYEVSMIRNCARIPVGASIIAVARVS